jgi:hypothetical protein
MKMKRKGIIIDVKESKRAYLITKGYSEVKEKLTEKEIKNG